MRIFPTGPVLTAAEMRASEDAVMASGVTVHELMERAGAAVAEAVRRYGGGDAVLVLCGPGNNGGDGYVAARILAKHGMAVRVAMSGPPATDAAKAARAAWTGPVEALDDGAPAPVLVDALFGTGLSRQLGDAIRKPLHRLAADARFVVAVDVPSGVAADDGADLGAVKADITVALAAAKPAHLLQPAAGLCGHVRVADIGIVASSATGVIAKPVLPAPGPRDNKYTRGLVTVMGGPMAGAAALAASAAQRAGAGYVVLASGGANTGAMALVHRSAADALKDDRISSIVVGPGLGRTAEARALLNQLIDASPALVIDADALRLIEDDDYRRFARRNAPVILTPHAGEFDALFGDTGGSKIDRARAAAKRSGCKIVFKGADTVIASGDGRASIAPPMPSSLATAGTGDVLAGIMGAMLGRGLGPHRAACAAVWLQGEAARRAGPSIIADDLCLHLPASVAACH